MVDPFAPVAMICPLRLQFGFPLRAGGKGEGNAAAPSPHETRHVQRRSTWSEGTAEHQTMESFGRLSPYGDWTDPLVPGLTFPHDVFAAARFSSPRRVGGEGSGNGPSAPQRPLHTNLLLFSTKWRTRGVPIGEGR